jgi:hypothetical protein
VNDVLQTYCSFNTHTQMIRTSSFLKATDWNTFHLLAKTNWARYFRMKWFIQNVADCISISKLLSRIIYWLSQKMGNLLKIGYFWLEVEVNELKCLSGRKKSFNRYSLVLHFIIFLFRTFSFLVWFIFVPLLNKGSCKYRENIARSNSFLFHLNFRAKNSKSSIFRKFKISVLKNCSI